MQKNSIFRRFAQDGRRSAHSRRPEAPDRGMSKSSDYSVFFLFYVTPAASIKPITSSHHNRGEKEKKDAKINKICKFWTQNI